MKQNNLTLSPYVPFQKSSLNRTEPTIFQHVYGNRRQQPSAVCLNTQWLPAIHALDANEPSGNDLTNRNLKKKTFFDTYATQERRQPKDVTPPNSDYTDAYLAAFAPKFIPAKNFHRLTTPVFAHVEPIPLEDLRTQFSNDDSIRTSRTRSNHIQALNLFDRIRPFSPNLDSTYVSNYFSSSANRSQPFSYVQNTSSETVTESTDQPTLFKVLSTNQTELSYENTEKNRLSPDSLSATPSRSSTSPFSSSTKSAYKPSVSFQSAIPSVSNDTYSITNNKTTISPSSTIEKRIGQPETLVFRPDEDVASFFNEKSSQITSPLSDFVTTPVESKLESEKTLSASSKPIEILESTLNKYDTIINQISDILSSVSPLSSTLSSFSPGQSVLDYELTANGSPILRSNHLESQQSTTSITNANASRTKSKYLIRDDSYDKIVTAITDLEIELTPLSDLAKLTKVIEEENNQSIKTIPSSINNNENYKESESLSDSEKDETLSTKQYEDEHYVSLSSEVINEEKNIVDTQLSNESPSDNKELIQTEEQLISNVVSQEKAYETIHQSYEEGIRKQTNMNDLLNSNIVLNEENDESRPYQNQAEETRSSNEQQIITFSNEDRQDIVSDSMEPKLICTGQQLKTIIILPDTLTSSTSPVDTQPIVGADISSQNTFPTDEHSNVISNITSQVDIVNQQIEDLESEQISQTSIQTIGDFENAVIKTNANSPSPLIIKSPIFVIENSVSNRYISSDVYHGYQGEHKQLKEVR